MHTLDELQSLYATYLNKNSYNQEPATLYEPVNYILSLGGKRLRPLLSLMAFELYDTKIEKALCIAHSVEVFHNFTLVHDDIMDQAEMRRGKITVHSKYGINTGILSGDVMLILAYESLLHFQIPAKIPSLVRIFNQFAREVCEGQEMDMLFESSSDVSLQAYEKMISLKTAVLLAGALKMGAIAAGSTESDALHLYDFGLNIGIAFQIQDDYLDTFGTQAQVGKQIGGDIIQNKKTFLILKAMEVGNPEQKQQLLDLFNPINHLPATEKIERVTSILSDLNIPEMANQRKQYFFERGIRSLEEVQVLDEKKSLLKKIAFQLLEREN
ncbi:MAG: polyprenyl synthetase family protein [Bacteroidetes bacterium]|nr:polyprenyl synthetase family protein [Bacteroidota bacterium]